jgi:hypothetical protein
MKLRVSDKKWACVGALCLLGIAAFIMFAVRPGGFETAIGRFFLLLPGSIPAYVVSDRVYRLAPKVEPVVYWTLIIGLSFVWYWGISYVVIKIFRGRSIRNGIGGER